MAVIDDLMFQVNCLNNLVTSTKRANAGVIDNNFDKFWELHTNNIIRLLVSFTSENQSLIARIAELNDEVEYLATELSDAEDRICELEHELDEYSGWEYERICKELSAEYEHDLI